MMTDQILDLKEGKKLGFADVVSLDRSDNIYFQQNFTDTSSKADVKVL